MNRSALATLAPLSALALALSLAGCFGGEDGGAGTPVVPKDTTQTVRKVSPGLYVGDYKPYDTSNILESEFSLGQDGAFRFFWIAENEPVADFKGSWFQKDSNLHFTGMTEAYVNRGFFGPGQPMEDDTNSVRDITDSSFWRKEWTPLRQKPYWVAYKKKAFNRLKSGDYQYLREIKVDSATNLTVRIKIELDGTDFLYRYSEDSLESFQAKAVWFQQGSILGTEKNEGRSYDTTTKELGAWEAIPGALLQRVSEVSDTGFKMWTPPSLFNAGTWDIYSKVP
jgi:hypothetical protein